MRKLLLAGAVLAVAACSSGNNDANNAAATDNLMVDQNMGATDMNAMTGTDANGMTATGTVDANSANLMEQDANTHDHDTNLANGI